MTSAFPFPHILEQWSDYVLENECDKDNENEGEVDVRPRIAQSFTNVAHHCPERNWFLQDVRRDRNEECIGCLRYE
jgi:hypothetical protein